MKAELLNQVANITKEITAIQNESVSFPSLTKEVIVLLLNFAQLLSVLVKWNVLLKCKVKLYVTEYLCFYWKM